MKVKLLSDHKSLKNGAEFELPNFSVLTGKNGSGKTHLLEAMADVNKTDVTVEGNKLNGIRFIVFNGLNPNVEEKCDPDIITRHNKNVWKQLESVLENLKRQFGDGFGEQTVYARLNNESYKAHCAKARETSLKSYSDLTERDIEDSFDISFISQNDFFTAQFALLFKNYHKLWLENKENEFYKSQGISVTSKILTEDEFIQKNGEPPWDFVNKILEETKIPYKVNNPLGDRKDSSFTLKLLDVNGGFEISSSNLSTGEKVLMSLALALYNTRDSKGKPDLLLIDEPDAALHPSMTKKMVSILKKNIVEDNNIPVVITTHSPTTVISAEGVSIYQVERGIGIPQKISTQSAVELLSGDIPFLKISTEKRRQVFVESKYDVLFYELLTNIYRRHEAFSCEPIYIPARTSSGSNCTDVLSIVDSLFKNGNDQVYGIIDWDLNNKSNERVLVVGEGERYAIENYLLDPLLMGLLMLRENYIKFEDVGSLSVQTYAQLGNLTFGDAQKIIDLILFKLNLDSQNRVDYKVFNGWELTVTHEFNVEQGHQLEALYKSKFPVLKRYKREYELKKEVVEKVINDYPGFSPLSIVETIKKIT
jgi:predicted ATPase